MAKGGATIEEIREIVRSYMPKKQESKKEKETVDRMKDWLDKFEKESGMVHARAKVALGKPGGRRSRRRKAKRGGGTVNALNNLFGLKKHISGKVLPPKEEPKKEQPPAPKPKNEEPKKEEPKKEEPKEEDPIPPSRSASVSEELPAKEPTPPAKLTIAEKMALAKQKAKELNDFSSRHTPGSTSKSSDPKIRHFGVQRDTRTGGRSRKTKRKTHRRRR